MPIHFVTDSTAYFTREYIREHNITMVPMHICIGDQDFEETFPGEDHHLYELMKESAARVSTSQPSVGAFVDAYEAALSKDCDVIALTLSSGVSGTYQAACIAADIVDSERIAVIDSHAGDSAVRMMIEDALERVKQGLKFPELTAFLRERVGKYPFAFTVATLEYLRRGGRLSNMQAILGSILQFRPWIKLIDGVMVAVDKMRGQGRVVEAMIQELPETVRRVGVVHVLNTEYAQRIAQTISEKYPRARVEVSEVCPVIGGQLGPGAVGICYDPGV